MVARFAPGQLRPICKRAASTSLAERRTASVFHGYLQACHEVRINFNSIGKLENKPGPNISPWVATGCGRFRLVSTSVRLAACRAGRASCGPLPLTPSCSFRRSRRPYIAMPDHPVNWSNFLEHAALSDVGLRRSNNQDSYVVMLAADEEGWRERGHVFMVADGMGAHAAGELASKLACNGVPHTYHKLLELYAHSPSRPSLACLLPVSCPSLARLLPVSCLSLARLLPVSCPSLARLLPVSCPSLARLLPVSHPSALSLSPVLTDDNTMPFYPHSSL